jgi:hypothetical protein
MEVEATSIGPRAATVPRSLINHGRKARVDVASNEDLLTSMLTSGSASTRAHSVRRACVISFSTFTPEATWINYPSDCSAQVENEHLLISNMDQSAELNCSA